MNCDNDIEYYRRREAAARGLAAQAGNPAISRVHLEMAEEYARRVGQAECSTPRAAAAR
ncbi:hypothetical protein [Sphingomonas sp.]|jgi:hypothetical protein|uniref:hypothetical protein n=1 Tax=Sphingomonas sp. TaxID=28214 RepID=UPI002E310A42|nr:hypothetical protein [Sphingomonas sp.]HEX4694214.1 hypothetical protein [Sphingomonas sp.]